MAGDSDWQDLEDEALLELGPDDFEDFCAALVRYEACDRHASPVVDGPVPGKDGGRDVLLTLSRPPRVSKAEYAAEYKLGPITEDPVPGTAETRIAYSCKTGEEWFETARKEAAGTGTERGVEALSEGGYFKLLIHRPGKLDAPIPRGRGKNKVEKTAHEWLSEAYWDRLRAIDPNAPDPRARIQILDAGALASFLRSRQPESGDVEKWADKLDVRLPLRSPGEWDTSHRIDREKPPFEPEPIRTTIQTSIIEFFEDSENATACLVGEPGVGKTRLVLEVLDATPHLAQRVRVALNTTEARDALDQRILKRHPSLALIVDDCLADELAVLERQFRKAATTADAKAAKMIALVPSGDASPPMLTWKLGPLEPAPTRAFVATLLERSVDDPEVGQLASLSSGYPWFARLLADEHPTRGRAPTDIREAALWALASDREAETMHVGALELRNNRARALLAVILTPNVDWAQLAEPRRESLAKAVGLASWTALMERAVECRQRGILRRTLGWEIKYVTPHVLAREVIAMLLGPDGPDPGGRTLAAHAPDWLDALFAAVDRLGLHADTIRAMVDTARSDLAQASHSLDNFSSVGLIPTRLRFLADHDPVVTARVLRAMIDAHDLDQLRQARRERRNLVWALERLAANEATFDDAETVLFRLACAENETWANNATGTWAQLFRLVQPYVPLLLRRLADPDPVARTVALIAVSAAMTTQGRRLHPDDPALRSAFVQIWQALGSMFADPSEDVSRKAKQLATQQLRGALRWGIFSDACDVLEQHAATLDERERILLRDKLQEVREYDQALVDASARQPGALEARLAPCTYRDRLRQQIGVWGPASLRDESPRYDDELARDGLVGDVPLRAELEWLLTNEAQRAQPFAYAIGRVDRTGLLFDDLRRLARSHDSWRAQTMVARYLGGMAEAGDTDRAEQLLAVLLSDPLDVVPAAWGIVELGATAERRAWMRDAIRRGAFDELAIQEIIRLQARWLDSATDAECLDVATAIHERATPLHAMLTVELLTHRYRRTSPPSEALALLEAALTAIDPGLLHGVVDLYWARALELLIDQGRIERAAGIVTQSLTRDDQPESLWRMLHRLFEVDSDVAFRALIMVLELRTDVVERVIMGFHYHRESFDWPLDTCLAWVGVDPARAHILARLVWIGTDDLPAILRELVRRFGPTGRVADDLIASFGSTHGLVPSLAEHDLTQLGRARTWVDDLDPSIAAFARRLVEQLERNYERHAAYEQAHRHFGT